MLFNLFVLRLIIYFFGHLNIIIGNEPSKKYIATSLKIQYEHILYRMYRLEIKGGDSVINDIILTFFNNTK